MTTKRSHVRYITLADENHQPLGVVANGGADWTLNCGRCSHATPGTTPGAAVAELLEHIERAHSAAAIVERIEVVDQGA
jgi:hypothetical protein